MLETAALAFTTFFATVSPIDIAGVYAVITVNNTPRQRVSMALRGCLIATVLLVVFTIFGEALLAQLGISLAALKTAGGILLLLMAINMVFSKDSRAGSTSKKMQNKNDVAAFPLATPLIAGPGTMGAGILLFANTEGNTMLQITVLGALLLVLVITYL